MLFDAREEDPGARRPRRLPGHGALDPAGVKRPQMQWNTLAGPHARRPAVRRPRARSVGLLRPLVPRRARRSVGRRRHVRVRRARSRPPSARGNVFATQFHPEKSGAAGLPLLRQLHVAGCGRRAARMIELYPAIDLRAGRACASTRATTTARPSTATTRSPSPTGFAAAGATLDPRRRPRRRPHGRAGEPGRRRRDRAAVDALGAAGADAAVACASEAAAAASPTPASTRVVIGTAAMEDPALVRRIAARQPVAVGLDGRSGEVAVRRLVGGCGRERRSTCCRRFEDAGVDAVVITEISRDGTLDGPDLDGLAAAARPHRASRSSPVGGVGSLDDLRALARLEVDGRRLAGAIIGKALYEGRFTVAEALAALGSDGRRRRCSARPGHPLPRRRPTGGS